MSTAVDTLSKCAGCRNGGVNLKSCSACKLVKYCSVECQKANRSRHKKECRARAAELYDEKLFAPPPPNKVCPICVLPLPLLDENQFYQSCCGKTLCSGCARTRVMQEQKCPCCNVPNFRSEEEKVAAIKARVEAGDVSAMNILGGYYQDGHIVPQSTREAIELWKSAGKLGGAGSYNMLANHYFNEKDMKKAIHYWELGAMGGHVFSRDSLGMIEESVNNNFKRAIMNYKISAACGCDESMERIKIFFKDKLVTKEDYRKALCAHKEARDGMKSEQRDAANIYFEKLSTGGDELLLDEPIFRQPPPLEDCPICFIPLPIISKERRYQACCGKVICLACLWTDRERNIRSQQKCPFCRAPCNVPDAKVLERLQKRADVGDPIGIQSLGNIYSRGEIVPQDRRKTLELWTKSANLGCLDAYYNLSDAYARGDGVEEDKKKSKYYLELGAMAGDIKSRHNLGTFEENEGNMNRAMKHYIISVGFGCDLSLVKLREGLTKGYVSDDDFNTALRAYQAAKDEMKSEQREKVAKHLQTQTCQGDLRGL